MPAALARPSARPAAPPSRVTARAPGRRGIGSALLLCLLAGVSAPPAGAAGSADAAASAGTDAGSALTLERIFPEKDLFGPRPVSPAFSHDGAHAVFLWRPLRERRHGSDLWLVDAGTGSMRRLTSVSVLSRFQEATRRVRDDRRRKAEERRAREKRSARAETTVRTDDGLVGEWSGTLSGAAALGLGADEITLALTLARREDRTLDGTLRLNDRSSTLTAGLHDQLAGRLEAEFTDPESGLVARLTARIADDVLEGTLRIDAFDATLAVRMVRRSAGTDDADGTGRTGTSDGAAAARQAGAADTGGTTTLDEDEVGDDDADDTKAPRYGGVQSFVWSPVADEFIFVSAGDLYLYRIGDDSIERLTRTREPAGGVQWLPDGSGYLFLRGGRLQRVRFGDHRIEHVDPPLGGGATMTAFRLSPDGSHLAFVATTGSPPLSTGEQVNIVNYRGRFAGVTQVTRHMPDRELPEFRWHWYLLDLRDGIREEAKPRRVHTHTMTGPRDIATTPNWSPGSDRFVFATFAQATGQAEVREVRLDPDPPVPAGDPDGAPAAPPAATPPARPAAPASGDAAAEEGPPARLALRFLHAGGPNTPRMFDPRYAADGRDIILLTELSGYRHLHRLDPRYEHLTQLTSGRFEVYPFEFSRDHRFAFALTTRPHAAEQAVERIDLDTGEHRTLSPPGGFHSDPAVDPAGMRCIALRADYGAPPELVLHDPSDDRTTILTDSHSDEAKALTQASPEYFTFENRHGQEIHGHMFRPPGFTPQDRRPLLVYVYGGPLGTRKMISRGSFDAPGYFFARYMAERHGYVCVTVDPRGASGFGGLFEKSSFEQVGRPQAEDLVDAVRWMIGRGGIDPARVGLHGWSFGGFQTQMCLYLEPDVFACGIAGAGPTEWENYNTWYTTGTIGPAERGRTAHEKWSLLPLAKNLRAKLLLVHGMEDANVLYQDTVRVYRELLKAGKEALVELFLDPTGGHGLGGDVKTQARYRKYEEFLLRCLGRSEDAPARAGDAPSDPPVAGAGGGVLGAILRHRQEAPAPR